MTGHLRPLITPRVNLNGTSKEDLVRQYTRVMRHLDETLGLMGEATPHGRDFQTFPDGAMLTTSARAAWHDRMQVLSAIRAEVEKLAISINDQ